MDISADLDLIGGMMGTDKSSADHNYLVHYDRLFRDMRSAAFNFIEIGVFRGASVATWREYFNRATVIGVDIQESCRQYSRDGILVEIGSQDDPEFLLDLTRRYPPRVIIDDGSHMAHHIVFTFETLFPALEPGGLYVVEDLHFHAGAMRDHHRGPSQINPIDYFLDLSRILAANELEPERQWGFPGYASRSIDEITFFGRAVALRKKPRQSDDGQRLNAVISMAENMGTADAWERASKFLAGNGDLGGAISAIQRAVAIEPQARLHLRLSELYARRGIHDAALHHAETAVERATDPDNRGVCLERLGDALVSLHRFAEAVPAFQQAADLVRHPVVRKRIEDKATQWAREG